jgi:hypothetical protein
MEEDIMRKPMRSASVIVLVCASLGAARADETEPPLERLTQAVESVRTVTVGAYQNDYDAASGAPSPMKLAKIPGAK